MGVKMPDVQLRLPEPTDVDFLYALENARENWTVSNTSLPFSREVLMQYARSAHDIYAEKQVRFMIEATAGCAGMVDLFDFEPLHQRAAVGIILAPEFRGQGIGAAALKKIGEYGHDHLGLRQLHCLIPGNNHASVVLFEKAGFKQAGVYKNWLRHTDGSWVNVHIYQCFLTGNG